MLRVFCACLGLALALLAAGVSAAQTQRPQTSGQAQPPLQPQPETIAPQSQPPQQPPPVAPSVQQPAGSLPVRVLDQPLSVKVIEAPKTEAQFDAEQKERDSKAALNDQLLIYAALIVAIGAFLAIAFTVQVFYLGLGLRAMRRSSQQAERNIRATQRAFVYVSELAWNAAGANLGISPVWANSGTTPTRRLRIATNWKASHGELPPDFDINYARPPEELFLGPAAKAEFGTIFVPMRDIQAAIEERLHVYVWGRATYNDIFEGTKPHFFEFCHRLDVAGEAPGNIKLRFAQFGLGNGSDEDSQPLAEASS
jgi:hypothetical protein